jgi:hypothetical protein
MRERKQKPRRKPQPEHDPTLHPHHHAFSGHKKGDEFVCWHCGEHEHKHKQKVVVKKGKRLVVPVEYGKSWQEEKVRC